MSLEKRRKPSLTKKVVLLGGALATAAIGSSYFDDNPENKPKIEKSIVEKVPKLPKRERIKIEAPDFLKYKKDPRPYSTLALEGKKIGYPVNTYFGHNREQKYGPITQVDFKYQLAHAWERQAHKLIWKADVERLSREEDEAAKHDPEHKRLSDREINLRAAALHKDDPRLQFINTLVMSYDPDKAESMTLPVYYLELTESIKVARAELDWKKVQTEFQLSGPQMKFLKNTEHYLDPATLFAVHLSEIMPSNGKVAIDTFGALLQSGGAEFIFRLPSDDRVLLSFGPGQITDAIFQRNGTSGSLNIMGNFLHHRVLPEDISHIKGVQHHIASYLNGLHNLIRLTITLEDNEATALAEAPIGDDIRMFVSGAHNRPASALSAFERFTDSYIQTMKHGKMARPHFETFTDQWIKTYVARAKENLAAVRHAGNLSSNTSVARR